MEESGAPDGVEGKARGDQDSLASHGISVTIYFPKLSRHLSQTQPPCKVWLPSPIFFLSSSPCPTPFSLSRWPTEECYSCTHRYFMLLVCRFCLPVYLSVCASLTCLVPVEVRRGHRSSGTEAGSHHVVAGT